MRIKISLSPLPFTRGKPTKRTQLATCVNIPYIQLDLDRFAHISVSCNMKKKEIQAYPFYSNKSY